MKKVLLALLLAVSAYATTVTQTIVYGNNKPWAGTVTLNLLSPTTNAGNYVIAASFPVPVGTTGVFSANLAPGTYSVKYSPALPGALPFWGVPSSGPTTISAIETTTVASPSLAIAPAQITPSITNGYVLTTVSGVSIWAPATGGSSGTGGVYCAGSGTNAVFCTGSPAPTSYTTGLTVSLLVGTTNTGSVLLNINSVGLTPVLTAAGAALSGGELQTGWSYTLYYNGSSFVMVGGSVSKVFGRIGAVVAQSGDYTVGQVTGAESTANKGTANGYAPLNGSSQVPLANLPTIPYSQTSGTQASLGFTPANVVNNLSDLASAPTARTNLGLGTAATQASSAFDASGAAAAAQGASLQKTSNLSDLANAGTARTNLGLGAAATQALSAFLQTVNNLSDLANAATARTNLGLGAAALKGVQGTGANAATATGSYTTGHCLQVDANGNFVDAGAACGTGSGAAWGSITGTLSSQSDLNTALNGKAASTASTTVNGQTCTLGASCTVSAPAFPNAGLGGSIIAVNGTINAAVLLFPTASYSGSSTACASTIAWQWPAAGYFRSFTTQWAGSSSPAVAWRTGASIDCGGYQSGAQSISPGGMIIPPFSTQESFSDSDFIWHENLGAIWAFGTNKQGAGSAVGYISSMAAEFVADSGLMTTALTGAYSYALTASTAAFCGFAGTCGTNELEYATPIPFAATAQNLSYSQITVPTNSFSVFLNDNGANTTATVNPLSADASPMAYMDVTHTPTLAAGDYIDIALAPGAGTVSTVKGIGLAVVPVSGTTFMVYGAMENTVSTTLTTFGPFGSLTGPYSGDYIYGSVAFPRGCTASKFYVTLAGTQPAGVTTTVSVVDIGTVFGSPTPTIMTGTISAGTTPGVILLDGSSTPTINKGDRITVSAQSSGGTSAILGHWAFGCQ